MHFNRRRRISRLRSNHFKTAGHFIAHAVCHSVAIISRPQVISLHTECAPYNPPVSLSLDSPLYTKGPFCIQCYALMPYCKQVADAIQGVALIPYRFRGFILHSITSGLIFHSTICTSTVSAFQSSKTNFKIAKQSFQDRRSFHCTRSVP